MKKTRLFTITLLSVLLLSACSSDTAAEKNYVDKEVVVYHKASIINDKVSLRFYNDQPNVPYIEVNKYFEEFFDTTLDRKVENGVYKYINKGGDYLGFDIDRQIFSSNALDNFNHHPDFAMSSGKTFIKETSIKVSKAQVRAISLKDYEIPIYTETNRVYVPLTLLSKFMGGSSMYNVAYNGKDVYVIDRNGQLGEPSDYSSYPTYYEVLNNLDAPRPADLANYVYNELCLVWDNMRGLTSQMVLGDANLQTLGLNGTLEMYLPELKGYLTSTDRTKYYQGYHTLFSGLYDGGHTSELASFEKYTKELKDGADNVASFADVNYIAGLRGSTKLVNMACYVSTKNSKFDYNYSQGQRNYYYYDDTYKTSYIGFDSFQYDFEAWDNYYNNNSPIPTSTDSFAFIREKLLEAKSDGAENIVLDLTTNGGGAVAALIGIVGLFNHAKGYYSMSDVFNHSRSVEEFTLDLNLDGKWDDDDIAFADQFNFNVGVLTSSFSFSCGNYFPCVMKELGYKILGDRSGGGSCTVNYESTADGMPYARSSAHCMTTLKGENVDSGVVPDLIIEKAASYLPEPMFDSKNFFDPSITGTYLSTAYDA